MIRTLLTLIVALLSGATASAQLKPVVTPTARTFDALHYSIKTDFDRRNRSIRGETTVSLRPLRDGLATVQLDSVGLSYRSVSLTPNGQRLNFRTRDGRILIELDRSYRADETIRLTLNYTGRPKRGIRFVGADYAGGQLIHDAQIWTQGQANFSRHWFPSYDLPDDKATSEQFLTVAAGETAIANGKLVSVASNPDGTRTFHFHMEQPHSTYLTSFVIGRYVRKTDDYRGVPLGFYVYPGREPLFETAFGKTKEMLRIFEEMTGSRYPWPKYDQTIVGKFPLGGMENITATTYSDREIFFVEQNQLIIEDLVAHELAHSWFGNLVTCRNWSELWLNEGFATFMEAAFRERMYGRDEYIRKLRDDRDEYFAAEPFIRQKHGVFNHLADGGEMMFDEVTYQKGGLVVHMLRETVGDDAFWRGVRLYLDRFKFGNVESRDLQKIMEEVSGRSLDSFFQQWVYRGGFPDVEVTRSFNPATRDLTLKFVQKQTASEVVPAVFEIPLEIQIGDRLERIRLKSREESFVFTVSGDPEIIRFDPAFRLPLVSIAFTNPPSRTASQKQKSQSR